MHKGGLGACSARKFFKIRYSEITSEAIFVLKYIFGLDAARIPGLSVFGVPLAMFRDRRAINTHVSATGYGHKGHRTMQTV